MKGSSGSFPTNPHYKPPYWISVGIGAAYVMRPSWSLSCYTLLRPVKAPEPDPSAHDFEGLIEKGLTNELIKKALFFPESARLKGISNYK